MERLRRRPEQSANKSPARVTGAARIASNAMIKDLARIVGAGAVCVVTVERKSFVLFPLQQGRCRSDMQIVSICLRPPFSMPCFNERSGTNRLYLHLQRDRSITSSCQRLGNTAQRKSSAGTISPTPYIGRDTGETRRLFFLDHTSCESTTVGRGLALCSSGWRCPTPCPEFLTLVHVSRTNLSPPGNA